MMRTLGIVIVTTAALVVHAADRESGEKRADGILELSLPSSASPLSWAPERVSKLAIDGKDHSIPRLTKRSVAVRLKKGADSVKVVYTYWHNPYTRIIRT